MSSATTATTATLPAPAALLPMTTPVVERGVPFLGALPSMLRNAPRTLLEAQAIDTGPLDLLAEQRFD